MQGQGTACKLMDLHCMQTYVTACKLMDLHAFLNILHAFWTILEHSASILDYSGTFCMPSGTFWNILDVVEGCRKVDFQVDDTRTDGQTYIRTC